MSKKTKLLTPEVAEKARAGLEEIGKNGAIAVKLKIILAADEHGISKVGRIMGVTKTTITSWIKILSAGKPESLKLKPGRGRKPLLTGEQEKTIEEWIENDSQLTIQHLQEKIHQKMFVRLGKSSVYNIIKNLRFSYITPRTQHYKKSALDDRIAKKKSSSAC